MLPKKNRLTKKEVDFVLKKGKTYKQGFLLLKIFRRKDFLFPCFSVIVPVKVAKKSTKRNKIKRQIRESLRKKICSIKGGFCGIIMALPEALGKNYKEIDREVEKLLKTANCQKIKK